jgi:hypothetical protein
LKEPNKLKKILRNKTQEEINKEAEKSISNHDYKIYSLLTFKMSNGRRECTNRDLNATENFRLIIWSLIEMKRRPSILSRNKQDLIKSY